SVITTPPPETCPLSLHDALPISPKADVPVKVPVHGIPRIAVPGAPHGCGRGRIPPESRQTRTRRADGRINPRAGAGPGVEDAVGVHDDVTDARGGQHRVQRRSGAARGPPAAPGAVPAAPSEGRQGPVA